MKFSSILWMCAAPQNNERCCQTNENSHRIAGAT